jgi:phospholipase/lecithinase/hemolysin
MATAGTQLAAIVREQIVARGAGAVVVNSLPDVAVAPGALALPAPFLPLVTSMVAAFNDQLKAGVDAEAKVRYVDLYALTRDQAFNPSQYGLTNITAPACGQNALAGSALLCTVRNLVAGDVSHYMFADGAHPTPYQHWLLARYIAQHMAGKGWM